MVISIHFCTHTYILYQSAPIGDQRWRNYFDHCRRVHTGRTARLTLVSGVERSEGDLYNGYDLCRGDSVLCSVVSAIPVVVGDGYRLLSAGEPDVILLSSGDSLLRFPVNKLLYLLSAGEPLLRRFSTNGEALYGIPAGERLLLRLSNNGEALYLFSAGETLLLRLSVNGVLYRFSRGEPLLRRGSGVIAPGEYVHALFEATGRFSVREPLPYLSSGD